MGGCVWVAEHEAGDLFGCVYVYVWVWVGCWGGDGGGGGFGGM